MFHVRDNLFFGRMSDGAVRVLKFKSAPASSPSAMLSYPPHLIEYEFIVPAASWASVVASVSLQGEDHGRFYVAQSFHMNPRPTGFNANAI